MTRFDTLELTTKTDFLQSFDSTLFTQTNVIKPNGLNYTNYSLQKKRNGLLKITINDLNNNINIKLSSKILGTNYEQGICKKTIEQVLHEINRSGIVLTKDFINQSTVKYADIKNDLNLTKEPNEYINSLNHLIAPRFNKTKYEYGISFNEKIKNQPVRLTSYSKEHEIIQNKKFYNEHPELSSKFQNILRIESRLPSPATIRKYFKTNDLISLLNASNINYLILEKIIDKQVNFNSNLNLIEMTNTEEKNIGQIYMLNDYYNGNFDSIYNHIKSKYSDRTKVTGLRQKIKKLLMIIKNSDSNITLDNLNELTTLLKEQ